MLLSDTHAPRVLFWAATMVAINVGTRALCEDANRNIVQGYRPWGMTYGAGENETTFGAGFKLLVGIAKEFFNVDVRVKLLVGDHSQALVNAFTAHNPDGLFGTCYPHASRNILAELKDRCVPSKIDGSVVDAEDMVQICYTQALRLHWCRTQVGPNPKRSCAGDPSPKTLNWW